MFINILMSYNETYIDQALFLRSLMAEMTETIVENYTPEILSSDNDKYEFTHNNMNKWVYYSYNNYNNS